MGSSLNKKIRCVLQCNTRLNRKATCLKRSFDDVNRLLKRACNSHCCKSKTGKSKQSH